jgi:SHS2 domain-containing protein
MAALAGHGEDHEHVGELVFELAAPTLAGIFAAAAQALAEEESDDARVGEPAGPARPVELEASDAATLLVDWINELVYLTETAGRPFPVADFEELSERRLRARVRPASGSVRHAVKAATLHQAAVWREGDGWRGRVTVDV